MGDVGQAQRVRLTPIQRYQILINQRTEVLSRSGIITQEFVLELLNTVEKQNKSTARVSLFTAIYLTILYIAYTNSDVSISILGLSFKEVPRLMEISVTLVSIGMVSVGASLLNAEMLRVSVESVLSKIIVDDFLAHNLLQYKGGPTTNFLYPFRNSLRFGSETIQPTSITSIINYCVHAIIIFTIFSVHLIPIIFLLFFAVPSMETSIVTIGIGILAWCSSMFLLISLAAVFVKLPYVEYLNEVADDNH